MYTPSQKFPYTFVWASVENLMTKNCTLLHPLHSLSSKPFSTSNVTPATRPSLPELLILIQPSDESYIPLSNAISQNWLRVLAPPFAEGGIVLATSALIQHSALSTQHSALSTLYSVLCMWSWSWSWARYTFLSFFPSFSASTCHSFFFLFSFC